MTVPQTSSAGPGFDSFGTVQIPIQPITPSRNPPIAPGDPALGILLDYFQAFLVNDQNAAVAWRVPGVDPAHPPVASTFPFDPEEYVFRSNCLPSLYLWRDSGSIDWIADDWDVSTDRLKLLWVLPLGKPEDAIPSSSFVNGLVKAVNVAIERGRTPSWQVANDPDPLASSQGSFLGTALNAYALWLKSWRRTRVTERDLSGNVVVIFPAVEMILTFQETWFGDITGGGTSPTSATNGVDMTIDNAQGTPMVEGHLSGTPVSD